MKPLCRKSLWETRPRPEPPGQQDIASHLLLGPLHTPRCKNSSGVCCHWASTTNRIRPTCRPTVRRSARKMAVCVCSDSSKPPGGLKRKHFIVGECGSGEVWEITTLILPKTEDLIKTEGFLTDSRPLQ